MASNILGCNQGPRNESVDLGATAYLAEQVFIVPTA